MMKKTKNLFVTALIILCMMTLIVSTSAAGISDLDTDNWAYPYASALVDTGIMETDEYGNFYPDVPTSRGEFVKALWRAFGSEYIDVEYPTFSDVGIYSDYMISVEWAYLNNITSGIDANHFGPDLDLTREQAFTFLYRTMEYMGIAPTYDDGHESYKQITEFNDYHMVSDWSADAIQLLMDIGIVTGSDTNEVWPHMSVNNAATATILFKTIVYMDIPSVDDYIGYWMYDSGVLLEIDNQGEWSLYDSEGALMSFGYVEYTGDGAWLQFYDGSSGGGKVSFDQDGNLCDGEQILTWFDVFPYN